MHHHLVRTKQRTQVGLIVECGDAREVHHMALLIGYGAGAINPYLAFESIEDLIAADDGRACTASAGWTRTRRCSNYIKACGKGVLKVMSKMGVSTVASYTGAQIFEAIGLGDELVDRYFTGTVSRLGGIGLDEIAAEVAARHAVAHPQPSRGAGPPQARARRRVPVAPRGRVPPVQPGDGVQAAARHAGQALRHLQGVHAARSTTSRERLATLRGLFRFKDGERAADRRSTRSSRSRRSSGASRPGAMSYGSISAEAHETLAIAMNRLGAKSNTGEGGEDAERLHDPDAALGDQAGGVRPLRRHVASTSPTPTTCRSRWPRGPSPARAASCPGTRCTRGSPRPGTRRPGVGLISPPPHHDIYSIEDLKQLIHDLKNSNPSARVHVKLVAEMGVGTVAAGVSARPRPTSC